jgi:flagellar biosynthesis GTPase FlhF
MKTDRLMLLGLLAVVVGVFTFGIIQANKAHAQEAAQLRQHEIAHEQNERRATQKAYAEHLAREAYGRAHPEVVAARKAAAKAEGQRQELAREEQARDDAEAKRVAQAQQADANAKQDKENHPCDTMWTYQHSATDAYNSDNYQAAFDAAVSGLHYAEACDSDTAGMIAKGYLLFDKAISEKHLSSGDSEVDVNQAVTLLSSCQSTPGVYGTETAARCEKTEDNAIRYKMQWEEENDSN